MIVSFPTRLPGELSIYKTHLQNPFLLGDSPAVQHLMKFRRQCFKAYI